MAGTAILSAAALLTAVAVLLLARAAADLGSAVELVSRVRVTRSAEAVRLLDEQVGALSRSVESRHRR